MINSGQDGIYCICDPRTNKLFSAHKNKVEALIEASRLRRSGTAVKIWFVWNHNAFKSMNHDLLGKIPLTTLYKERAQQLRDKYDTLILYYSGGADSNNILQTFLRNNIKLDYVFVRWPFSIIDKGIYVPNTQDTTAINFLSEWDYCIKPDLEYLRSNHPEIKILTSDWLEKIKDTDYNDDLFKTQNHMHSAVNFLRMQSYSETEIKLLEQGKKVAAIWGTDKPYLHIKHGNKVYFYFRDDVMQNAVPVHRDSNNIEYFYWTPDLPLLAYEMAYQVYLKFIHTPEITRYIDVSKNYPIASEIIKDVCYPYWNKQRFQAGKPRGFRKDKDFWFYDNDELLPLIDKWLHYYKNQFDNIDKDYLYLDILGNPVAFRYIESPWYYLGEIDKNIKLR